MKTAKQVLMAVLAPVLIENLIENRIRFSAQA
jgi:hypothetical protein